MEGNPDVECGSQGTRQEEMKEPLIIYQDGQISNSGGCRNDKGYIWVALLSTFVAVCGSFLFGSCVPFLQAKVGRQKDFEVALRRLSGKDADISIEAAEIQDYIETLEKLPKAKIFDLFQRRYARSVEVGLMVFQQFGGINGIIFYASETFVFAGFSSGKFGTIAMGMRPDPGHCTGCSFNG